MKQPWPEYMADTTPEYLLEKAILYIENVERLLAAGRTDVQTETSRAISNIRFVLEHEKENG